jgi:predicted acyl esterase
MSLSGSSAVRGVALAFAFAFGVAFADDKLQPTATHMVEMSDGVHLATDVYLPPPDQLPAPAVLILTPYGRSGAAGFAQTFLKSGYAVVSQDIRGRGQSEGLSYVIFQSGGWNEPRDGHATIEWIARQDWSSGAVATYGGSAVGITQNMLAPGAPEALKAQHVVVATGNLYADCMYRGGAFHRSMIEGWLAALNITKGNLDAYRAHPAYDEFWETMNPQKHADRTVAPGVFIGGWYDIFCQGTIDSFTAIQERGGPAARGRCRLVMGPWAHGPFNELKYPPESNVHPPAADPVRYFDCFVKGVSNGADEDPPVHYWVMGDPEDPSAPGNEWRTAETWPPPSTPCNFYFHPDGRLSTSPPKGDDARSYRFDPRKPVPTVGGQNLILEKGPMDQRRIESRPDVLVFTSDVFETPFEATGRIVATLYVASDAPDTDFTVKLTDVYPDGRSMLVADGILRARYHRSFSEPCLLEPGRVYKIEVDLWSTSLIFNRGHRLRVAVSSSNSPRFDVNPNTGRFSWEETDPRIAVNTVHLSARYPSHVTLPAAR